MSFFLTQKQYALIQIHRVNNMKQFNVYDKPTINITKIIVCALNLNQSKCANLNKINTILKQEIKTKTLHYDGIKTTPNKKITKKEKSNET
jgi:hypothetical protein